MKKNTTQQYPIPLLREDLRQRANALAARLSRSVARLTSCDSLPCLEYGEEIQTEYALVQELFYLQQCRNALERCIAGRGSVLRYRWPNGAVTVTRMRKIGPNRVRVTGLADIPSESGRPLSA